jgi:hypothetical protein
MDINNPNPYHLELRRDTGFQEILAEGDISASSDKAAIKQLCRWRQNYARVVRPGVPLIGVCTNNWTEETLYQDAPYDEREMLRVVKDFVYEHHEGLTKESAETFLIGQDLSNFRTNNGYLFFTIEQVKLVEIVYEDGEPVYYVRATLCFEANTILYEAITDVYKCFRDEFDWTVEWHAFWEKNNEKE